MTGSIFKIKKLKRTYVTLKNYNFITYRDKPYLRHCFEYLASFNDNIKVTFYVHLCSTPG